MEVNGTKITLKKKSGPGELIGIVELEVKDNKVTFQGIQFSQAGDYVISVISTESFVENSEFSIKIDPPDEVIEQKPQEENKNTEGNRPIIAQIEQPRYKLPPMKFDVQKTATGPGGASENAEIANDIGFKPFLWYNGAIINHYDITSLELSNDGVVPKCVVQFADSHNLVTGNEFKPTDDSKFEIFFTSNSKVLKPIHIKFKIENFQQNKKDNSVIFYGTMDIPEFYKINGKAYKGTSFEALKMISQELSLGYNSNITNTDDSMVWKAANKTWKDLILKIIQHSYISDDAFVTGYIDYYYCFNYIDVEKEWNRDISKDIGIDSTSVGATNPEQKEKTVELILNNDPSSNQSSMYFARHSIKNDSTEISTKTGQFIKSMVYDRLKKTFQVFDVQSLSSKGSDKLILKGSEMDDKEHRTNFRTEFSGFIDTENTHKNYLYAESQNKVNFNNLKRINAELELPKPNFNLYKFQKVRLDFITQKTTPNEPKPLDERLSGEWIVLDIKYIWKQRRLVQVVDVCRKEYGKTREEKLNQKTKPSETPNNEKNQNQPVTTPKANESYEVGKEYTIRAQNGKNYVISVKKLDPNGTDISATIRAVDGSGLPPNLQ